MIMLPIETNPYIKAFTYHSYPLSILGSSRYCGEKKAEISIKEADKSKWKYCTNNISVDNNENDYIISGNKYADNVQARIYREADNEDELIVKINYIQYTQPYGYVSIFLSNSEAYSSDYKNTECYHHIGVYNKGDVFSESNQNFEICKSVSCTESGYYMKLERKNTNIKYWISFNAEEWILITKNDLQDYDSTQKLYMGVYLFLGENQFYNWLFTNYIQLYGRNVFDSEYFVDYFVTPEKDGNFYTVHSLLDFYIMDKSILNESNADIIQFTKSSINKGKYVEFYLNEYYIEGKEAYKNYVYYHTNLIYGYDEIGVYILGYDKGGYIKNKRLEYADFLKSIDNNINKISVYSFAPLDNYYKLNIETIKSLLYEYWKGINTNLRIEFILPKGERYESSTLNNYKLNIYNKTSYENLPELLNMYGMKIYELFLKNEIMFAYLLKDSRIPFIIYEHKKIMKDRILFLQEKKHIKIEYMDKVIMDTDALVEKAIMFLNICLKYRMKPSDKDKIRVREILEALKKLEENYYPKIIESLY